MSRRKISPKKTTKKLSREGNSIPWRYCFLTLCCGLLLVIGFFFAARQHFSSIDFSIKNSRLKKQVDELEDEKRRLILDKESALTPSEIKKAAQKIGLIDKMESSEEIIRTNAEPLKVEKPIAAKPKKEVINKSDETKPPEKKVEKEDKKTPSVKREKETSSVKTAKN